ncbi:MAG: hypothetical protein GXO14_01520 [Thermococci archaeon]|nr:hypothetical protein [Thermococci archaeon]
MRENERTPFSRVMLRWLNVIFDLVVIALGTFTMAYVVYMLWELILSSVRSFDVEAVLHQVVLIVIFLEIFEMLMIYIREHHVSMRNIVELGVLAMIRKLIVSTDYNQMEWQKLVAIAVLIFVMGWIYVQEKKVHLITDGRT